ncbi:MAG: hypothetical protein ACI9ES_000740 [Oceanospirillaceae bacterium]|jgi:hypothetical protein
MKFSNKFNIRAIAIVVMSSLTACSSIERIRSESLFEQFCNEEGRVGQFIYERVALGAEFFKPIPADEIELRRLDKGYYINDRKLLIDKDVFNQVYERNGLKKTVLSDVGPIYSIETTIVRKSDGKILSKAVSLLNMLGQTRGKYPIYGVYCRQGRDVKWGSLHYKEHSNLIDKTFSSNL